MNTKTLLKRLGLVVVSTALTFSYTSAEPEKQTGEPEKAEKHADKAEKHADKAEKHADKAGKQPDKAEKHTNKPQKHADKPDNKRTYQKGEFKERFHQTDRDRVTTYFSKYKGHKHGLPPELAKKWEGGRRLPAGWRDRIVTGYVIEDAWYPAFVSIPYVWFPEIVVIPDTQLYWYGDRVIRVYVPTREVVDVIIIPTIHIDL